MSHGSENVSMGEDFHLNSTDESIQLIKQWDSPINQTISPASLNSAHAYITVPITLPGSKPGEANQTVHIQMLNPNPITCTTNPKLQIGQFQIPIQDYTEGTTVLTVAFNPNDGGIFQSHGLSEGVTLLTALQPNDLQPSISQTHIKGIDFHSDRNTVNIKQEPLMSLHSSISNYIAQKNQIIRQSTVHSEQASQTKININSGESQKPSSSIISAQNVAGNKNSKNPKTGRVHIATAIDGTTLFCCPECQMAYTDKTLLEHHLLVHKIERRWICDICGAGLKRKEHLERHKMGHNPERPYVCNVCAKGFKRKEHLNLHFVIHSGQKTEICGECGKGFYRKDHLRKHVKSHSFKRAKLQNSAQSSVKNSSDKKQAPTEATLHIPTSDNTVLPVQIQLPAPFSYKKDFSQSSKK